MTQMIINLGFNEAASLTFDILDSPVARLWVERMNYRHSWPMDNPDRFYGFNSYEEEQRRALDTMDRCIQEVNQYRSIINRKLTSVTDQDTLNYLHNIFERYHGQLEQQDHEFWKLAPESVRRALAEINITVHHCESLRRGKLYPRFVCTWYGMPKTKTLDTSLQDQYGSSGSEFGGVYLNYCEIGKTATDMAYDNDQYMAAKMFQPFKHYSADFRVDLYSESAAEIEYRQNKTTEYFNTNLNFFRKFNITDSTDIRIQPLKFKVAQLVYEPDEKERIMLQIRANQSVQSVTIK